jgi:Ras family protein T1
LLRHPIFDCFPSFRLQDEDGALSEVEMADVFSTSPGNPWLGTGFPDTTVTSLGKVTLQGVR